MYAIRENFGSLGYGQVIALAQTIGEARETLESKFGIVFFEVDQDGADAADAFCNNGCLYVIETARHD